MMIKSHRATKEMFFSQVVDPMDRNSVRNHIHEVVLFYLEHMTNKAESNSVMIEKDYQELLAFITFGTYGLCGN